MRVQLMLCLSCVSCVAGANLDGQAPADTGLVGIWGSETAYGPLVRGELTVAQTATGWTARIAGFEVTPRIDHDTVRVVLPRDQGEFRGRRTPDGRSIAGFWVQPGGVVFNNSYATPTRLDRVAGVTDAVWRGVVDPLAEGFSLYLLVQRRPDGSLLGSFHNPEANSRGGAAAFHIEQTGQAVRFTDTASSSANGPPRTFTGVLDSAQHQIVIPWDDIGRPIVLTSRTRDDAIGLFPRTPAPGRYAYRVPLGDGGDGWTTARAASVGLDEDRLGELVDHVATVDPAVDSAPLIQSILVARHGRLVLEEYFFGFDKERTHDSRSAAKTFASVMVGAAILHGVAIGPSSPVYAEYKSAGPFAHPDPRKEEITVAHLMTHSTGLACDDNGEPQPGNEDVMQAQRAQPDWYKYVLDLPMTYDPGQHYAYCSGTMNLVGGAVAAATGSWLPDLFERWIALPLGIRRYHINLMPTGQAYFGGGMYLRPRDLLKLGVTYLNGGVWNGHRIVSQAWVRQSTTQQIGPPKAASADGYAWHLNTLTVAGHSYREYEANGNGGQFLIVLPDLDIALVFTGGDYGRYRIWRRWRDDLVPEYVIKAVKTGTVKTGR